MPAGPADIGITEASETLTQTVDLEGKLSDVVRKNKDGGFAVANAWDPVVTGSIKVLGTTADVVGESLTTALASVDSGKIIITEKTHTRTQDNYDETDIAFSQWPNADDGS